eukprot:TRINITY_DN2053_c0_g1_i21.p1 TRINITY_DN2053_c0_g1~~TRINITY_DN2053_c0_g1_i21.p1  ORF type:complete len:114 (-),score=42.29 TRINITY_DN2053_c0_g1_i21:155-496(-)
MINDGQVSTFADKNSFGFNSPMGITYAGNGSFLVTDLHRLLRIEMPPIKYFHIQELKAKSDLYNEQLQQKQQLEEELANCEKNELIYQKEIETTTKLLDKIVGDLQKLKLTNQ